MTHDILPFGSPLYNTISDIRYNLYWVWRKQEILNKPYVGDCSARNSYDELRDNLELGNKQNTLAGSIEE